MMTILWILFFVLMNGNMIAWLFKSVQTNSYIEMVLSSIFIVDFGVLAVVIKMYLFNELEE